VADPPIHWRAVKGADQVLESQAVEEPLSGGGHEPLETSRPLPDVGRRKEIETWRGEVRNAAIAAAGGIVAGAATVAAARAVKGAGRASGRGLLSRRRQERPVIASRSFLIDVHVLGNR
jgi:hypothetical protein